MTPSPDQKIGDDALMAFWSAHVPESFAGVLAGDGWAWDAARQGYRGDTGTWLAGASMDALARSLVLSAELQLEQNIDLFLGGRIRLDPWKQQAFEDATGLMIVLGMFASGGADSLEDEDWQTIDGEESTDEAMGSGLADIRLRLGGFASELKEQDAGSDAQIVHRAGQYASGGWPIYQSIRRQSHARASDDYGRKIYLMERNVLDPTCDHCSDMPLTPGCPRIAAMGWQPIGTLPRIGDRSCGPSCRCSWQYDLIGDI